jgi:hypothetical protein
VTAHHPQPDCQSREHRRSIACSQRTCCSTHTTGAQPAFIWGAFSEGRTQRGAPAQRQQRQRWLRDGEIKPAGSWSNAMDKGRISKEFRDMEKHGKDSPVNASLVGDDLTHWKGSLRGPVRAPVPRARRARSVVPGAVRARPSPASAAGPALTLAAALPRSCRRARRTRAVISW